MKQRFFICFALFGGVILSGQIHAEGVDQQLLYAQTVYQQAFSQQTKSHDRVKDAQEKLNGAQSRLNEAQQAFQRAQSEMTAAQSAQTAADNAMTQATANLKAAWQRKDGGQ